MSPPNPLPARTLTSVTGEPITVPDLELLTHLQFRRFAGCPVCTLHLRSFTDRHTEIRTAGIREVAVFHSRAEQLRTYTAGLPLDLIADPERRLYREFGVETSARALLDPRGWPTVARAVGLELTGRHDVRSAPPARPDGGRLGLPADFLIRPDGTVLAAKYGTHVADHWSVDEVLALGAGHPATAGVQTPAPKE